MIRVVPNLGLVETIINSGGSKQPNFISTYPHQDSPHMRTALLQRLIVVTALLALIGSVVTQLPPQVCLQPFAFPVPIWMGSSKYKILCLNSATSSWKGIPKPDSILRFLFRRQVVTNIYLY